MHACSIITHAKIGPGVIYTHWTSNACPSGSITAYSGNVLLSAAERPRFSQPLCYTTEANSTLSTIESQAVTTMLSRIMCSVCLLPAQSVIFEHYGSSVCPTGWNPVYDGVLVVLMNSNVTAPICASTSGSSLQSILSITFLTDVNGRQLTCSLCSM